MDYAWVCIDSFDIVRHFNEVHETNKNWVDFGIVGLLSWWKMNKWIVLSWYLD
jgi:hypothetical protein